MKNRFAALEGQQSSTMASRSVEVVGAAQNESPAEVAQPAATQPTVVIPDDLTVIKGIGPVIASKLNQAGIFTFEQLGGIDAARLREIVGDVIQRLADEDHLLQQARDLAAQKRRGG